MKRNVESHFALNPTGLDMRRSKFSRNSSLKTSMNFGDIVPLYVDEVLPGDTFSVKSSKVVRMSTPITPVMDNAYLDFYWFFVPNRLVWEHWKNFMGENTVSAWIPETEYEIPQITAPADTGWEVGTIADYLGIPTGVPGLSVNALFFRAYSLICQEWFRSEVLTDPLNIPTGDSTVVGSNGDDYIDDVAKGGKPFVAAKGHDYFTSALPNPQRGPDVPIPVTSGGSTVDSLPVFGNGKALGLYGNKKGSTDLIGVGLSGTASSFEFGESTLLGSDIGSHDFNGNTLRTDYYSIGVLPKDIAGENPENSGLYADASAMGININVGTINQLRTAFQLQKLYEKDALFGGRYISQIKAHFGVTCPDYRLQRPEYLGGNRVPITMNQVVQQSETGTTPQGNTAAFSLTTDVHGDFSHSFTEHGILMCLGVARYTHTYQQGLERMFSRKGRFDYFYPVLANLGNMSILNKEVYAQGPDVINEDTGKAYDDEVFGYQEAWADYRYKPSKVTGEMRSSYAQSLDIWHYADDYESLPFLSDEWIREDKSNIDRTLAVKSSVSNQLFGDFYFDCTCTRVMPLYSMPGLIDHH